MISQQELQKYAEKCGHNEKFKWDEDCPRCLYDGDDCPTTCCAFCTMYAECKMVQNIAETICKREYDEEMAKKARVPTPV